MTNEQFNSILDKAKDNAFYTEVIKEASEVIELSQPYINNFDLTVEDRCLSFKFEIDTEAKYKFIEICIHNKVQWDNSVNNWLYTKNSKEGHETETCLGVDNLAVAIRQLFEEGSSHYCN